MTVAGVAPTPARAVTGNVAEIAPALTVTLVGTMTGSVPDNETIAPPVGAAAVSVTVPVTELPSTTVGALSAIPASASAVRPVTVNTDDRPLVLFIVAMTVAVPGLTAVTANAALKDPIGIVMVAGTVATDASLVDIVMVDVVVCGGEIETEPCSVVPAAALVPFKATVSVRSGDIGDEEEPHWMVASRATRAPQRAISFIQAR